MVNGHIKRKKIIICSMIIVLMISVVFVVCVFLKRGSEVSFEMNDKEFFRQFADMYDAINDEYEFHSLDAYYLKDTRTFYYNAKYTSYSPIDDTWYDVDEVMYGTIGGFSSSYCLSWDGLHGFENVDKEFKRAQKEGVHKTYTQEEISKFLEEAFKEKENK